MAQISKRWLSVHVFLADPGLQERYLAERLAPCLRTWRADGLVTQWFFIRYWEGGPHLRIRLAGDIADHAASVVAALQKDIDTWRSPAPPERDDYYRAHAFDGVEVDAASLPWYPEGSVELIDYVPETQRYGGAQALLANEELFELSSELALSLCRTAPQAMNARLSLAYSLMAAGALATGLPIAGLGQCFQRYAAYWAQHSAQTRALAERLAAQPAAASADQVGVLLRLAQARASGSDPRNAAAAWAGGVAGLVAQLKRLQEQRSLYLPYDGALAGDEQGYELTVHSIVGSQLHMLNNRLGIVPPAELVLATSLARAAAQAGQPMAVSLEGA